SLLPIDGRVLKVGVRRCRPHVEARPEAPLLPFEQPAAQEQERPDTTPLACPEVAQACGLPEGAAVLAPLPPVDAEREDATLSLVGTQREEPRHQAVAS